MRIKKFRDQNGQFFIAVQREEKWIIVEKVANASGHSILKQLNGDMITFLEYYKTNKKDVCELIRTASKDAYAEESLEEVMPFQPVLYRDFLLTEEHYINCSRGMAKMFLPWTTPIIKGYEFITRKPFPALKPKKRFYQNPIYYKGNHLSFSGDNTDIEFPDYATVKDYELELGIIISRSVKDASLEEAEEAIGGFCIFNDFSARNMQMPEMDSTGPCKTKDFASAISNVVVTSDEILPFLENLETRVFINEKLVATGHMNSFYHSIASAVAYASMGEKLMPGEFMGSGTIPNCCGMENGHLLKSGDTIRLEIDRIGSLTNHIV